MQKVLIVDDIQENLYFLEVLLKGHGFEPVCALNGAEALTSARSAPPALIISDILMPVMDGYALCREWHGDERLKSIPFIFYTATFTERQDEELALSLGADRFLIKPLEPDVLIRCVHEVLAAIPEKRVLSDDGTLGSEMGLLREYNEALFRKLEKKMADLELANRELRQRMEEQKRLEEQLRQAQKMEAVGRFSAGIAHDFNNILTVIFGYSYVMQGRLAGDPELRGMLDSILEAADRAKSLAASLLTFSRKHPLRLARLDLNLAISGVDTFLRRVIGDDVELAIDPACEKLPVLADKGHIEQVLVNLAVNARDAMPQGGKLAISTCRLTVDEKFVLEQGYGVPGRYALLSVADSGVGMDQDTCQRIFEPFFTTKESGRGTGLGLSIVYGIVQQHHGIIHVASRPGHGSTFHILLPLVECCADDVTLPEQPKVPAGGNETILVVDNDEAIRTYLEIFLSTLGYRVLQACDGLEAVRRFRERDGRIDLVLMDVIMPHKTGREAAIEMKVLREQVKIIFISGYVPDGSGERHLLPEGAEFIMKPLAPCDLALKVRQMLDS